MSVQHEETLVERPKSSLVKRSKVNLDLRYLSIVIVLLDQPLLVSIMTLASSVIEKSTFQEYSH